MLLRMYSYLFLAILSLFVFGIGLVGWLSGAGNMRLRLLPFWQGAELQYWLLGLGVCGLLAAAWALLGKWRVPAALLTLGAFGLLVYSYVFSRFYFQRPGDAEFAGWLLLAALVAVYGSMRAARQQSRA
jgi:hypothetical protein